MYTSAIALKELPWLACLLALVILPAHAQQQHAPRQPQQQQQPLPIHIQADNAELAQKSGKSTYTGNVVLTRGGLTLTGDKLVVTQLNNRNNIRAVLTGAPAHLHKQPDRNGNDVFTGHSHRIEYANNNATIVLRGDAVVTRADGDQVTGAVITHNLNTERTQAKSGHNKRVRITIVPHNNNHGGGGK
jgi:lipopolysaccharide export system protein LptA